MGRLKIFLPLILAAGIAVWFGSTLADDVSEKASERAVVWAEQEYQILLDMINRGDALSESQKARFEELSREFEPECGIRNPLDNQGGPDGFGYFYVDNVSPDTATFEWIELCGDPNATNGPQGDDASSLATWGWNFPFYGGTYTSVNVSTNALLQFNAPNTTFTNLCPYASGNPTNPQIAVYWDDLYALTGGGCNGNGTAPWVRWRDFTDYFVVMWDIPHIGETGNSRFHFEAILYPSGRIKFQYDTLYTTIYPNSGSIGLDAPGAGNGLEYLTCNSNTLPSGTHDLAIWFFPSATGSVSGTVVDDSNIPVPNASVRIIQTGATAVTDGSGNYTFPMVAIGTYDLVAQKFGFESDTVTNVVVTENQNTDVDFTLVSQEVLIYPYTGNPVPITDNDSSFAIINVPDDFEPTGAQVLINSITHTYDSDIDMYLRSPNGTQVELSTDNGGSGDNFINTLFDDAGPCVIGSVGCNTAPFTGTYQPEGELSTLVGISALGDWTLVIYDDLGGDIGTIDQWTLILGGSIGPEGTLSGTVRTLSNNQPLAGVNVVAVGAESDSTTTSAGGLYSLDLPVDIYTVYFSHAGYCDSAVTNVVITENQITTLDVDLRNPEADISVTSITHQGVAGEISSTTFDFSNTGNCELSFTITDDQPWLSTVPNQGDIAGGGTQQITVWFDAGSLTPGDYTGTLTVTHNASGSPVSIPVDLQIILSGADDIGDAMPTEFALKGNYPNPFNSRTEIRYDLPQAAHVSLVLYNMLGQEVRNLVNATMPAGRQVALWDGRDNVGLDMTSGLYILRLEAAEHIFTGKVMLLK